MSQNLDKTLMYESVKSIIECADNHVHLSQHKLFTLFSIAFNYMLYSSGNEPGAYIIRVEDRHLADKLARKAKDLNTRRFFDKLILPAKMAYGKSTFYLDYFQLASWKRVNALEANKIKMALIIKNTSSRPISEYLDDPEDEEQMREYELEQQNLQEMLYYSTLQEKADKTVAIGYDVHFPNSTEIQFPFIKRDENRALGGVKLSADFDFNENREKK